FRVDAGTVISGEADAAASLTALITARTGLTLGERGGAADGGAAGAQADTEAGGADADAGAIRLRIEPGGRPESYTLTADAASVRVTGADAAGLFYGVHTLVQLLEPATGVENGTRSPGTPDAWAVPAVRIIDAPRFAYRGVM